jgi:23S rRNA (uracil1939-C5)-methyltransferase
LLEIGTVVDLTHAGEGVVRNGKATFVAGALPDERIEFERIKRHKQHDIGRLLNILAPSAAREDPRCAHFGVCGGCVLQHLAPDAQLIAKEQQLREVLERVARVTPLTWRAPLAGPQWQYRRRARLGAKYVAKKERVLVGFRERHAPYVAALQGCEVLSGPVGQLPAGQLIEPLSQLLTGLSIRQHIPQIEVAVADNALALVLRILTDLPPQDAVQLCRFAVTHQVDFYLQRGGLDTVAPLKCEQHVVQPLYYQLPKSGLKFEFQPTDFIQINAQINEALVEIALESLELDSSATVLDLFCGLGNFTLPLAQRAGHVVGVEGERTLIDRAQRNAALNNIANVEFHVADLSQSVEHLVTRWDTGFSHVLLDPPRTGAIGILPTIARFKPQRLLYISCHPGSLARDIAILVHDYGYVLKSAGVLDMFPHTAHVESIAVLEPAPSR